MKTTMYAVALLLLSGCKIWPSSQPAATAHQATPLGGAAAQADAATAKSDAAVKDAQAKSLARDARVLANINTAKGANAGNPDGPPKTIIDGELGTAQANLADVQPDPAELAAAAQRTALVESGKAAEARAAYTASSAQATKLSSDLDAARAAVTSAQAERDAARIAEKQAQADYVALTEKNKKDNDALLQQKDVEKKQAVQAAIDKANSEVLRTQERWLNIAGAVCLLILFGGIGFGGLAGAKEVWPFGAFAMMCFGLAQIISQWWFMWACLAVALIAVGIAVWWIVKHYKLGTLQADTAKKAATLESAVHDLVPNFDNAYASADQATKQFIKANVYDKLLDTTSSLLHGVRATQATTATPVA